MEKLYREDNPEGIIFFRPCRVERRPEGAGAGRMVRPTSLVTRRAVRGACAESNECCEAWLRHALQCGMPSTGIEVRWVLR